MSDSQSQDGGGERLVLRWVFVRGEERIDLCRSADPTSTQVDVSDGGVMRAFRFANRAAVVAFHAGFADQAHLTRAVRGSVGCV